MKNKELQALTNEKDKLQAQLEEMHSHQTQIVQAVQTGIRAAIEKQLETFVEPTQIVLDQRYTQVNELETQLALLRTTFRYHEQSKSIPKLNRLGREHEWQVELNHAVDKIARLERDLQQSKQASAKDITQLKGQLDKHAKEFQIAKDELAGADKLIAQYTLEAT